MAPDNAMSDFVADDYLYQHRDDVVGNSSQATSLVASSLSPSVAAVPSPAGNSAKPLDNQPSVLPGMTGGFVDGSIEDEGSLESQIRSSVLTTGSDALIDTGLQFLDNSANIVSLYWNTTGAVSLLQTPGNTALLLSHTSTGDTTVGQTIVMPTNAQSLQFDLGAQHPQPGDVLNILFNGTVLKSIDLTTVAAQGHESISLAGMTADTGTFTFDLTGSGTSPGTVTLDNIVVSTAPQVTSVLVDGTSWSPSFVSFLQSSGQGNGSGYAIPVGSSAN